MVDPDPPIVVEAVRTNGVSWRKWNSWKIADGALNGSSARRYDPSKAAAVKQC